MIFGFSGRTLEVFIYTFPPLPSPATARSLTGIKATPCSKTQSKSPPNSTSLVIEP